MSFVRDVCVETVSQTLYRPYSMCARPESPSVKGPWTNESAERFPLTWPRLYLTYRGPLRQTSPWDTVGTNVSLMVFWCRYVKTDAPNPTRRTWVRGGRRVEITPKYGSFQRLLSWCRTGVTRRVLWTSNLTWLTTGDYNHSSLKNWKVVYPRPFERRVTETTPGSTTHSWQDTQ